VALNMPVRAKDFHILQGAPKPWRHTSPTGVAVISWFCGDCGGRLYGDRAGREEIVNLRAGTLNDTKWLAPVAHLFMKPDDFRPLVQAWRAMWPDFHPQK
jgi:hypothetical protein